MKKSGTGQERQKPVTDERAEQISGIFIIVFMLLTPLTELISEGILHVPYFLQPIVSGICGCAGIFLTLEYLIGNKGRIRFCMSDVFVFLLLFFSCISFVFTTNREITVTGDQYDEWLIHFIGYYSLMLAASMVCSNLWRKRIFCAFMAVGVLQLLVSVFQCFGMQISYCYFDNGEHTDGRLVYGLTQHNNFYVAIGILITGAFVGAAIFSVKRFHRILFLALSAVSFFCLLKTGTRISWVALAGLMLFYAVSFLVMRNLDGLKKYLLRYLVILFLLAAVVFSMNAATTVLSDSIEETKTEETRMQYDRYWYDSFGNYRGYIWRFGLASVPKHWLTGIGLDNYASAFLENPEWKEGMFIQAKGHNEYIHTLVTQGVFAAVNYIVLLVYACVTGVRTVMRSKDREQRFLTWIFLGMFTGYVCQAMINSSVLNTAMYFWIVIGMIMPKDQQKAIGTAHKGEGDVTIDKEE